MYIVSCVSTHHRPANNSQLCQAEALQATLASNLTLSADSQWQAALAGQSSVRLPRNASAFTHVTGRESWLITTPYPLALSGPAVLFGARSAKRLHVATKRLLVRRSLATSGKCVTTRD